MVDLNFESFCVRGLRRFELLVADISGNPEPEKAQSWLGMLKKSAPILQGVRPTEPEPQPS